MGFLSIVNAILAFGLEVVALYLLGYMGTKFSSFWPLKLLGAIILVGFFVLIWGTFLAPNAEKRLTMPALLLAKLFILLLPNSYFIYQKQGSFAILWSAAVIFHLALAWWLGEL